MKPIFVLFAILAFANCSTFLRKLECTIKDITEAADSTACEGCAGKWTPPEDESGKGSCACEGEKTFKEGTGCADPDPQPDPEPTTSCTIATSDAIKKVEDKTKCTDCGFIWTESATAEKKCTCPTKDEEKAKIVGKTACETVCGYKWNSTTCSGMYVKIASALFALLFLL